MLQLSLQFLDRQLGRLSEKRGQTIDRTLLWRHGLSVRLVRRPRARRYLLSLQPDGTARLVLPRRGTEAEGLRFLERSEGWLLRRVSQWRERTAHSQPWREGTRFLFRGEGVVLTVKVSALGVQLVFSDQTLSVPEPLTDYRPAIFAHMRRLAERELPARTRELAQAHGIDIRRVSVRAQRTRWGSCSATGTISLNWRLIQTPPHVVDYLIIHELMHRREMNHSTRFWNRVAQACPDFRAAEKWLKTSGIDLREKCSMA